MWLERQKLFVPAVTLRQMGNSSSTSAVKLDGRKINYYDFLTKAENADCNAAVERIYRRLDIGKINHFIEETPYISELQKAFYKRYIGARKSLILAPAYELSQLK